MAYFAYLTDLLVTFHPAKKSCSGVWVEHDAWFSPKGQLSCAVSLAVERPLHTRKVTGSNPVPRTISDFLTGLDWTDFFLSIALTTR